MKIPSGICTKDLYPNIYNDHIGRAMPEVLGLCSLTSAESDVPGAVEAVLIDTVNHEYLASAGSLYSIPQVYSNAALKTLTTHYSIIYKDGGRTYIRFTTSQKTKKVTFNAQGYFVDVWNSTNGYIQNPAYVLLYPLIYMIGVNESDIEMASFDDMAAYFDDGSWGEAGKLILQDQYDSVAVYQELLWSFGLKLWVANDGRLTIGRKGVTNFASSVFVFRQIDCLTDPVRAHNYDNAVNSVQYKYDSVPTAQIFKGAGEAVKQSSIDLLGEIPIEWEFPWAASETLVESRVAEELFKRAFGKSSIQVELDITWLDVLDIMDSFRFQDPMGIAADGSGEVGHYYYVTGIDVDFDGMKITLMGEDLQWLLRQYCILGDRDALASNWSAAPESSRIYCYLCDRDVGEFSDGEPGKVLVDRDLI